MTLPKEDTLHNMCKFICHYVCVSYPQVTWYPLKAIAEYHREQSPNRIYEPMLRKSMDNMSKKLVSSLIQVMKELHMISRPTNEERLIGTLRRILCFSDHLQ